MYQHKSWTIKKAEHWRTDAFELWCCRRLLRVPWTSRRSNQFILKKSVLNIHWKEWYWSGNSNTLATCCEELTHLKRPWCWERLKLGGEGDDRGWGSRMASLTQWTWVWVNSGSWWWTGRPACCSPWCRKELDTTEQLNWTDWLRYNSHAIQFTHLKHNSSFLIHSQNCATITILEYFHHPLKKPHTH